MGAVAGSELSPLDEQMLGDEIMREIRADKSYLDDPETIDYLNHLGYTLASVLPSHTYSYFFFPIKDGSMNAFAMPGGYIAVHTGLFTATQSENELAGVIAHEIGHVSQRHLARMIDAQKANPAITFGSLLLALLAARAGSADAAMGAMVGGQALIASKQLGYSRSHEREADRVAVDALYRAGFDPRGMESFFNRLYSSTRYYEAASPQYLSTHPLTLDRMSDMANRTKQLPAHTHASSLSYHIIRARLRVLQTSSHNELLKTAQTMRQEYSSTYEPKEKTALAYGLALAYDELKDSKNALAFASAALSASPDKTNLYLEKMSCDLRFKYGSRQIKEDSLAKAKRLAVNNPTSPIAVMLYADELYQLGRYKETLKFMRTQEAIDTSSPAYASVAAKCYKQLGQMSEHYRYIGDMYLAYGDKKAAEYQYQLARKANDGDYYTMSQVDAKLRSVREEILIDEKFKEN